MSSKSRKKSPAKFRDPGQIPNHRSARGQPVAESMVRSAQPLINLARALLFVSLAIAGYLAWVSVTKGSLAGCGPDTACDKALQSRWAYWLGIPVSIPALIIYATLLGATFQTGGSSSPHRRALAWRALIGLSSLVIAAAVWFVCLQIFVLKSFCPFCMTAHGAGIIASLLLLWNVPVRSTSGQQPLAESAFSIDLAIRNRLAWAGAVGVALLVAGQFLVSKKSYQVQTMPASPPAAATPKPEPRYLALHGGKFQLPVEELPMIGSPSATHIMVSLFDYTCHHCRDMHGLLLQAQQRFSNRLGIVSLPMPLDAACNFVMVQTPSAHVNACQYAKLGLAVWRADRKAFPQFDSWIFEPASPKPIDEVKEYAKSLVGAEKLEAALTNSWVSSQIQLDVELYDTNRRMMTNGSMPQLIIGQAISVGSLNNVEDLYRLLAQHFGLKPEP